MYHSKIEIERLKKELAEAREDNSALVKRERANKVIRGAEITTLEHDLADAKKELAATRKEVQRQCDIKTKHFQKMLSSDRQQKTQKMIIERLKRYLVEAQKELATAKEEIYALKQSDDRRKSDLEDCQRQRRDLGNAKKRLIKEARSQSRQKDDYHICSTMWRERSTKLKAELADAKRALAVREASLEWIRQRARQHRFRLHFGWILDELIGQTEGAKIVKNQEKKNNDMA